MAETPYAYILFFSTGHAIRAEKMLARAAIPSKLVPVPRHLSSNCGSCLRIDPLHKDRSEACLNNAHVEIEMIRCAE